MNQALLQTLMEMQVSLKVSPAEFATHLAMTAVMTCKMHGVDPVQFLEDVLALCEEGHVEVTVHCDNTPEGRRAAIRELREKLKERGVDPDAGNTTVSVVPIRRRERN